MHGQVNVQLATDRPERLAKGARWFARGRWLTVVAAIAAPGPLAGHVRGDPRPGSRAQRFTNTPAYAEPLEDPEELWVHELIGVPVVEVDGTARGTCVAVIDNPAADLLELDSGALVPVVFVTEHSPERIVIDPPAGLFELTRVAPCASTSSRIFPDVVDAFCCGQPARQGPRAPGCSTCAPTTRATTPPTSTAPSTTARSAAAPGC